VKFFLTLLRRNGKRLPTTEVAQSPRLVTVGLTAVEGFRLAEATCCMGGSTVARLWEPVLAGMREEDMTLHGFERLDGASMVQQWRLRPHVVPPWPLPAQ
jgi:hypothetical protein